MSHIEARPLKRRKIERTQLLEKFEAAHDDIPYLDVDVGMGIDFGGDDFFFSSSRLTRQWSHLGNDLDMGRMDEAIDLRHSSEVEFSTIPATYINAVHRNLVKPVEFHAPLPTSLEGTISQLNWTHETKRVDRSAVLCSLGTMLEQVHRTAMQQTQVSLEVKTSLITSMLGYAAIH